MRVTACDDAIAEGWSGHQRHRSISSHRSHIPAVGVRALIGGGDRKNAVSEVAEVMVEMVIVEF